MRGGFLSGFPTSGNKKKSAAKQDMLNQIRKGGVFKESSEDKFKKMLKQKMDDLMEKAMMGGGTKYGMPTNKDQPEKKMSKTMEKFYEQVRMKKKHEAAKIEAQKVVIKKKSFSNGGYIDSDGRVYDTSGKVVATVELKTGIIKNSLGMNIGKYKEGFMTNNKLSGIVAKSAPKAAFNPFGTASSESKPLNIWSTFEPKDDSNNSWW